MSYTQEELKDMFEAAQFLKDITLDSTSGNFKWFKECLDSNAAAETLNKRLEGVWPELSLLKNSYKLMELVYRLVQNPSIFEDYEYMKARLQALGESNNMGGQ